MGEAMTRADFLRKAGFAALAASATGVLAEPLAAKPNIVYILADDYGWGDVGFHGSDIKTPNLDRLAATGVRLESFYVLPVCTPTRSALMTGRYPIRYGRQYNVLRPNSMVGLSLDEQLLPEGLRSAGYETAICGKWHLGDFDPAYLPMARGFDHQFGFASRGEHFKHFPVKGDGLLRDQKACDDEGDMTKLITREAVGHLERRRASGKPLFLYVAYHAVHSPCESAPEYSAPYAHLGPERSVYAGMVADMDEGVGKILDTLEKQGLRESTLVIFHSDNGGMMKKSQKAASNGPLRGGKGDLYEGGTRVVSCASWPGHIPAGSVVKAPTHCVDWYPTLMKLAGAAFEQKKPLDGVDLWPVLTQGKAPPRETLLLNTVGRSGAVRQGDWKLLRNCDDIDDEEGEVKWTREEKAQRKKERAAAPDLIELFNLAEDPYEKNNLASKEPERTKSLLSLLEKFAKEAVPPILKPK